MNKMQVNKSQYLLILRGVIVLAPVLYALSASLLEPVFFLVVAWLAWQGRRFGGEMPDIRFWKPIRYTFYGLMGVLAFQLVPIPVGLLRYLSGGTYQALGMMIKPPPPFHAISVAPGETLTALMELCALALFFNTIVRINGEKEEFISLLNAVAVSAALLMAVGLSGILPDEFGTGGRYVSFYLAAVLPLVSALLFLNVRYLESSRGFLEKYFSLILKERKVMIYTLLAGVLGAGALFTRSYIAWWGCLASLLFLLMWSYYFKRPPGIRKKIRVLLIIVWVITLLAGLNNTANDLSTGGEARDESLRWRQTLAVIRAFPIFGSGFGSWQYAVDLHDAVYQARWPIHADIGYLEFIAENGAAGGGLMFLLLGLSLWSLTRAWWRRRHPQVKILSIGVSAFLVSCLFQFSFNTALRTPPLLFLFFLLLALGFRIALYKKDAGEVKQ